MTLLEQLLDSLYGVGQDEEARSLAARYAPVIQFDLREPFLPLAAGYTIFYQDGASPSFPRKIHLAPVDAPPAAFAIEYAIWWDWDIQHLYELEHVWVYVDDQGRVVRGEASWHGGFHDMAQDGVLWVQNNHLTVYSEPGKHAFAPALAWFEERWRDFKRSQAGMLAGHGGVLVKEQYQDRIPRTVLGDRLVHTYLSQQAFVPSWDFSRAFTFDPEMLIPWPALDCWIPDRVNAWLDKLGREIPPASFRFLRIGHRGARAYAPDNTLAGLRKAAELGADMVEIDVQRTADDHVILSHDPYLTDREGRVYPVRRSMLAELQCVDLGDGAHIPTLAEALDVCHKENMGVYIEIKDGGAIPAVLDIVREREMRGHVIIASFRPDWLAEVKFLDKKFKTSILFSSTNLDAVGLAQAIGANYVHPCWERYPQPSALLTPGWIARVRQANLGIICWHEERSEEIAALRQVGVDAICSDAPDLLL
ncbi:MAG: glycerophosphodiester phosphodiesterase [Anaerolineae bacterium]|nr:glycerophosphodiester phosphodiesterase [Anaerolineae bacterium]